MSKNKHFYPILTLMHMKRPKRQERILKWVKIKICTKYSMRSSFYLYFNCQIVKLLNYLQVESKTTKERRMNHQLLLKSIQMRAVIQGRGKTVVQVVKEKFPTISRSISTNARLSSHHRDFHNALPFSLRNPWLFSIKYLTIVTVGFSAPYLIVLYQLKKAL